MYELSSDYNELTSQELDEEEINDNGSDCTTAE